MPGDASSFQIDVRRASGPLHEAMINPAIEALYLHSEVRMTSQINVAPSNGVVSPRVPLEHERPSGLRALWWQVMDVRIGIIPLPVFVLMLGIIAGFLVTKAPSTVSAPPKAGVAAATTPMVAQVHPTPAAKPAPSAPSIPSDILMNIAVLAVGGFACGEIGRRLPYLNKIGSAAILATFVPSYLVYAHWLPSPIAQSVSDFNKQSNFLYLFISAIIVGSILGMDRRVLISGFLKIFVPMASASVAAAIVGGLVGLAVGLDLRHVMFFVVLPVLAGGVGEGAIPLSVGYASFGQQEQGALFAQILPPVMMGSLFAIVLAGCLNYIGQRYPSLTGNGRLERDADDDCVATPADGSVDPGTIAAAGVTAVALYLAGVLIQRLTGFPAPVSMLFFAVLIKLGQLVTPGLERGALTVYRFFSVAVTYPLLFAIGAAMTPWDKLVAAFNLPNVITIGATVVTLVTVGFVTGRMLRLYPIDTAIVTACRAAQGGTGDVAILTAADRMELMPFAQIATRIGGALTVTLAVIAFAKFS